MTVGLTGRNTIIPLRIHCLFCCVQEVVVDLDPHYIKGMQAMCAAEMMATLATYARPLEAYLKEQVGQAFPS